LLYVYFLPEVFTQLMQWSMTAKVLFSMLLICPLAVLMGMPFPVAMSELSASSKALIPWAWAINGCASVISAVLAALIAVQYGFTMVVGLAVLLYIVAAISFPGKVSA
jgi:hypothetical protein